MRVRQITVVDIVGPRADEFLLKVQQATAGPPWYMQSPPVVNKSIVYTVFIIIIIIIIVRLLQHLFYFIAHKIKAVIK